VLRPIACPDGRAQGAAAAAELDSAIVHGAADRPLRFHGGEMPGAGARARRPAVEVSADASPPDRLLGLSGRAPDWTPPTT
jgi:hypothetical protein